jgi:hypothetical protein
MTLLNIYDLMESLIILNSKYPSGLENRQLAGDSDLPPNLLDQIDFSDNSSLTSHVLGTCITTITLVSIVVSIRLIVRGILMRQLFLDDCKHFCALAPAGN